VPCQTIAQQKNLASLHWICFCIVCAAGFARKALQLFWGSCFSCSGVVRWQGPDANQGIIAAWLKLKLSPTGPAAYCLHAVSFACTIMALQGTRPATT